MLVLGSLLLGCHPGRYPGQVSVDGVDRTYLVYRPPHLDRAASVPLVVMIHGTTGSADEFYRHSGWAEKADRVTDGDDGPDEPPGMVVAFLQGQQYCGTADDGKLRVITTWDVPGVDFEAYGKCGRNDDQGVRVDAVHGRKVDDVAYVRAVVEQVEVDFPEVDPDRVYVSGFSAGGLMAAYLVQQVGGELFAAVGSASGSPPVSYGVAQRPVPVWHTIGSEDPYYIGDAGPIPVDRDAIHQANVQKAVRLYSGELGLAPDPEQYLTDAVAEDGDQPTATFVYGRNADGSDTSTPYTFSVLGGMGHHYPPIGPDNAEGGGDFDMPDLLWSFFLQYTRPPSE